MAVPPVGPTCPPTAKEVAALVAIGVEVWNPHRRPSWCWRGASTTTRWREAGPHCHHRKKRRLELADAATSDDGGGGIVWRRRCRFGRRGQEYWDRRGRTPCLVAAAAARGRGGGSE